MAKTKVYAPEGHHFMVNKEGGFYLMKNPSTGYKYHTANKEYSSLYILVEVRDYHASSINKSANSSYASITSNSSNSRRATSSTQSSTNTSSGRTSSRGTSSY